MNYVYVFINSALQDYVLIGESSDYKETLRIINNLHILPISFEPYLVYKNTDSLFSIDLFFHEFVSGDSIPEVSARYYNMSKEQAYQYLKEIALHYCNESDLVIVSDIEKREFPDSDEMNEYLANDGNIYVSESDTRVEEKRKVSNAELKKIVIKYIKDSGYKVHQNVSFSSLNKDGEHYWSNPPINYLNDDWTFIANDKKQKKIYLFEIKANTLNQSGKMRIRNDNHRKNVIDIGIVYGDPDFKDDYSGINFKPFLVATLDYNEELNNIVVYDSNDKIETNSDVNDLNVPNSEEIYIKNLDSETNFMLDTVPISITFLGEKHVVSTWSEAMSIIMETLYEYNPELLRKIAHMKSFSRFLRVNKGEPNCLPNESKFKEIKDSGIYYFYDNNESMHNIFHDFRKCISKYGFQGDDLKVEYKYQYLVSLDRKKRDEADIEYLLHEIMLS